MEDMYQGTRSQLAENAHYKALCQGTTLVVPIKSLEFLLRPSGRGRAQHALQWLFPPSCHAQPLRWQGSLPFLERLKNVTFFQLWSIKTAGCVVSSCKTQTTKKFEGEDLKMGRVIRL